MPCTCNAICDNDCGSNQLCTGHAPACANTFFFTGVGAGIVILADHLRELETAINTERVDAGRRFVAVDPAHCTTHTGGDVACNINDFSAKAFSGGGVGDEILASHWDDVKEANNEVVVLSTYGGIVTADFIDQASDVSSGKQDSVIRGLDVENLQTQINVTRNSCICDSHCNCDPSDCGCNGECPSDDYYYYYYYYP